MRKKKNKLKQSLTILLIIITLILIVIGFFSLNNNKKIKPIESQKQEQDEIDNQTPMTKTEKIKNELNKELPYKSDNFEIIPPSIETKGNYIIYIEKDSDKQLVYNWFNQQNLNKEDLHITWIYKD